MSVAPSPAPAPQETLDQRIARLKAELADAERQKLDDEMGQAAGAFFGVSQDGDDPVEIRAAIDFVRDAWKRFETWRVAHRSEAAVVAAERPCLALSPIALPADPRCQDVAAEVPETLAAAVPAPELKDRARRAPTGRRKCSRCGDNGHRAPECWSGQATPPAPTAPSAEDEYLPQDDALLGEPVAPPAKRPPGSGAVYRAGTGWRWSIRRAGMAALQGHTFPTEAEALADLDRVVAERAAGAAPPDLISMTPAVPVGPIAKENTCTACGERGHNARRHRLDALATRLAPEPPAAPVAPGPAARAPDAPVPIPPSAPVAPLRFSTRAEIDEEEDPASAARRRNLNHRRIERAKAAAPPPIAEDPEPDEAEDPLGGWSAADADGRQTCLPCGGEGIDNRPGEGAGRCCLHCDGEGYRWPEVDAAMSAPPAATTPAARAAAPTPPLAAESHPDYFHPGRGWGPVDASGVSVHALCGGTGKIRVKGVSRGCYPCDGTGKRQCVPRVAAEGRRTP